MQQPRAALAVTEQNQIFAENSNLSWNRSRILANSNRVPVAAQQLAHRSSTPDLNKVGLERRHSHFIAGPLVPRQRREHGELLPSIDLASGMVCLEVNPALLTKSTVARKVQICSFAVCKNAGSDRPRELTGRVRAVAIGWSRAEFSSSPISFDEPRRCDTAGSFASPALSGD
jgi:hypothetical protein